MTEVPSSHRIFYNPLRAPFLKNTQPQNNAAFSIVATCFSVTKCPFPLQPQNNHGIIVLSMEQKIVPIEI